MAKRSKVKKSPKKTSNTEFNRKIRHLETLLKYSLRSADGASEELDRLFTNQAEKIRKQIDKVKENQ